jgi:hypothetical protein
VRIAQIPTLHNATANSPGMATAVEATGTMEVADVDAALAKSHPKMAEQFDA